LSNISVAQELEFEVAEKACACLKEKSKVAEANSEPDCIPSAFAEVLLNLPDSSKKRYNDYNLIKATMLQANEILSVSCYEDGEKKYEKLAKHYYKDSEDESATGFYITTESMMAEGKYDLAVEGLNISIGIDSLFVKAYDHLGVSYRNLKMYDKAIDAYKKSLKLFPIGKTALMNIGLVYALNDDEVNSNKYYQRMMDVHPFDAEGYYGISKNYLKIGDYNTGLRYLCQAHQIYVEQDSDYQKDSQKLITMLYDRMQTKDQKKAFKKLVKQYGVKVK
jgi:tetratricopeptide (TPR) repeat protein